MDNDVPATMGDIYEYTGFWNRVGASIIDSLIIIVITFPILILFYGWQYLDSDEFFQGFVDVIMSWVFPLIATIAFWIYYQATPGKMAISAKIVDAKTGNKPTLQQFIVRYIGYIVSTIPLGLGFFWVAWEKKIQGWHDMLAGTVVINPKEGATKEVEFN